MPWASVIDSVKLAQDVLGFPAYDHVRSLFMADLDQDIGKWVESAKLRGDIGLAAKKAGWFKNIARGDKWFKSLTPAFADQGFSETDIAIKLSKLWEWAEHV